MKYDFNIDMSDNSSLSLLLGKIRPNSTVLEFGTATGYMTRLLKEQLNCSVWGVEIDAGAAELAAEYCKKMIVADLDAMTWPEELAGQSFDYIIFADVLEHLRDPWGVMKAAVDFLQPAGYVFTSIPNIGHNAVVMELLQGRFDYRSLGLLDDTHIRFFTRKSVINLLDKAGLVPIEWLNTMEKPENTEIAADSDLFVKPFQWLLTGRPDALVYQFVTISQKKAAGIQRQPSPLFQARYLHADCLQMYWGGDDGFSEACSTAASLADSEDFVEYTLPIPAGAAGHIRLDPGSKPAYIEIERIALYERTEDDSLRRIVAEWSADNGYTGLKPLYGVIVLNCQGQQQYSLMTLHGDPQLLLTNINLAQYASPLHLTVSLRIDYQRIKHTLQPLTDYYQSLLKTKDCEIEFLLAGLRQAETERRLLTAELRHTETELRHTETELRHTETELRHTELKLQQAEADILALLSSASWRMTAPLRKLKQFWIKRRLPSDS